MYENGLATARPANQNQKTFVLMNAYEARLPIKHFDLYRLGNGADLESLGFLDYLEDSAIVIEWGDRVPPARLGPHLRVDFETTGESRRRIRFRDEGRLVLIIGRPGHVEVLGIVEDLDAYDVVQSADDVKTYAHSRLGVICQTTTPRAWPPRFARQSKRRTRTPKPLL